jgi:hypothetical protein
MMETRQGSPGRQVSAQAAKEFLATIWLELLDWGAIAINSAGRILTALFNFIMLAIAAIIAALAVIVLLARKQIMKPSEASTVSLISVKTFFRSTQESDETPDFTGVWLLR